MEISDEPMQTLDLRGSAQQVLSWFENNAGGLEKYVRGVPDLSVEERRILAADALRAAVRRDEVEADNEIIGRELSADRLSTFESDVYAAAFTTNSIEKLFEWAGASRYLQSDADEGPDERGIREFVAKGFLAEVPEGARTFYAPLEATDGARTFRTMWPRYSARR